MAADVGLIKSVSQAYKNNEVNYNVGKGIADLGDKVAAGISKRGELQRAKEEKDNLRREKQSAAQKRSSDKFSNNLVEASGHAKTKKQTEMILSKAKDWRSESNGHFKIMSEFPSDSPEYASAQEGLLKIRTGMQNSVESLDNLNSIMSSRQELADKDGYADFNTVENGDAEPDDTIMNRTNSFLEEEYEAKWDDNGFLVIADGTDEEGNAKYSSIDDYDTTLARVADTEISDKFVGITDVLQKDGDLGKEIDVTDLEHDFNLYRENLKKPGQVRTDQLLTLFTDNPIPGVNLKETNEDLINRLQSSDIEIRTKAKSDAVNYLFGEENKGDGFLYKTAVKLHKGKLDRYNAIKQKEQEDRLAVARASGGTSKESEPAYKDRKSYEGIKGLRDRVVNNEDGTQSSFQSNLEALEKSTTHTGIPNDSNPHYKKMKELENDLRKVIGGVQSENLTLEYNGIDKGTYKISKTSIGQGNYTLDQIFSDDDTNPSNLLWAFNRKKTINE